eukprot:m.54069 g.54069  ORF g.54069 m.54069 type:complete len:181 (-) comp11387_c1_seq1:1920-2462(-)
MTQMGRMVLVALSLAACLLGTWAFDNEVALHQIPSYKNETCLGLANQAMCSNPLIFFLCATSCQNQEADECTDQDTLVKLVWELDSIHELAPQQDMTCSRTRAALQCLTEPFTSLCPQTCLACIEDKLKYVITAAADRVLVDVAESQLKSEILQKQYHCALQRKNASFSCESFNQPCPTF